MATRVNLSTRQSAALDLGTFLATAVAAFVFQWELKELLWGLWLSSLLVGYSLILWGIFWSIGFGKSTAEMPDSPVVRGIVTVGAGITALFMVGFFTVHFGGFHLVHGLFLSQFFPLGPDTHDGLFGYLRYLPKALALGWPLVLGSIVSSRDAFVRARTAFDPKTPYVNVIRMHLMIFVLVGARAAHFDNRWLYVGVMFFYFFPFRDVRDLVGGRETLARA